jgi:hypothetical protein
MATIPLPALHTAPIAPPASPLEMYAQMMGIKNEQQQMDQRQAMAPLQQQEAQNAVQSGQLDVEAKQRAAADQKAMMATMQQWWKAHSESASPAVTTTTGAVIDPQTGEQISSGSPVTVKGPAGAGAQGTSSSSMPSYDDLVPLAIKNRVSPLAVQGLQAHILDMKAKAATIVKDDAQAGTANADAIRIKNGMITDAMTGVSSLPDAQLPIGVLRAAQELYGKGIFDQQHLQMAQQLSNLAMTDPNQARQQLNIQNLSLGAFSKELENQGKLLLNQKDQATLGQEQAESQFYQQNGGAPGVSAEMMQQADWLKKNPGKGASDYKLWTLQHTPTAMMMNNLLGGPENQDALDLAANNYRQTGQMPSGLVRSPETTTAVIARAAQLDKQQGGQGIAANKAILGSNVASLKKLQTNFDQVQAFEGTAERNIDLLQKTAQKIPDLGARFANVPVRMINASMIGTDNMAAFKTALNTAQTESAKVLNSSNATGVLSDSARHELQEVIDGNMPYSAMVASLNTLKQDMENRTKSYQLLIQDIQNRLKPAQAGVGAGQPQNNGQSSGNGLNDPFSQFGGVAH